MTAIAPKPIIGSQRFRLIESISTHLAARLGKKREDFFAIFQVRLCQVVDTSIEGQPNSEQIELRHPIVDVAIFPLEKANAVASDPALLVFLDRDESNYERVLAHLDRKGIAYIFSTEHSLLAATEQQHFVERLTAKTVDSINKGKPFGRAENQVLSAVAAAVLRKDFKTPVLVTGQTVLSAFTDFSGYSHDKHHNQTDSDLLLCTAPPVSIPLLAIEIDGPHHYSEKYWVQQKQLSQGAAKERANREHEKTRQKDDALRSGGITVLHIRTDQWSSEARGILDRHTGTIASLVGRLIDFIDGQGDIIKKKYDYLHSIASRFAAVRDTAYSTHPELEDLVHIAPEVIEWLIRNLRELGAEAESLQNQVEAGYMDAPLSSPEELYGYPVLEQSEQQVIQELDADRLFEKLRCTPKIIRDPSSPTSPAQVQILYEPPIGRALELCTFTEMIPWMDIGGKDEEHFRRLLEFELAATLGHQYFRRLRGAEKDAWKARVLEHLKAQLDCANHESTLREFRDRYSKEGISFIQSRIDQMLSIQVRRQLELRGYIANKSSLKQSPALAKLFGRLVWKHREMPRPDYWDQEGEFPSVPLGKLLKVFLVLDRVTQKAIINRFNDYLHAQLILYREIPLSEEDWVPLQQHIGNLKRALGMTAPSGTNTEG